jgi:hypothetical protein
MTDPTIPPPGTVVDDQTAERLRAAGVPVKYGVVQAPEPSERVKRICSDDPAVWRPAVDEMVESIWPKSIAERHRREREQ